MQVSIVIPFYNEEENILPLAGQLAGVMADLPETEALFVDDGSSDDTPARIREAAEQYAFVRGVFCPANQGQSSAMLHGMQEANGEVIVTMDGDLQNNPADIPRLVKELGEHDAVCGYRAKRKDTWSRRAASRLANRVRNAVTHDGARDTGCSLKVFRRHCIGDLPWLNGVHRFMPAYFRLHGRDIIESPVDHRPREHGLSKYTNLNRLPRGIADLLGFWWYRKRFLKMLEVGR